MYRIIKDLRNPEYPYVVMWVEDADGVLRPRIFDGGYTMFEGESPDELVDMLANAVSLPVLHLIQGDGGERLVEL